MVVDALMVLAGAVAGMVVGMLWYSPLLFQKPWLAFSGITPESVEKHKAAGGMGVLYVKAFLVALVMSAAVYYFVSIVGALSLGEALMFGFILWLGFVATTMFSGVIWENKPLPLYLINVSHYLVVIMIQSALFYLSGGFL